MTYKALGVGAPVLWGPVVRVMSFAPRRALHRELLASRPDAIVSTYPLASLVLGRMRKKGWLRVPVATYLTDFAVHPLWVHPGVDLHLAVSPISAETAAKRGGRENHASGPLVGDKFRGPATERPTSRQEMRRRLGIGDDERAVLVVAGSWGVGDVPDTVDAILRTGRQAAGLAHRAHRGRNRDRLDRRDAGADGRGRRARRERRRPHRDGSLRRRGSCRDVPSHRRARQGKRQDHGHLWCEPLRPQQRGARGRARGGDDTWTRTRRADQRRARPLRGGSHRPCRRPRRRDPRRRAPHPVPAPEGAPAGIDRRGVDRRPVPRHDHRSPRGLGSRCRRGEAPEVRDS